MRVRRDLETLFSARRGLDVVSARPQADRQRAQEAGLVVDDEQLRHSRASGRLMMHRAATTGRVVDRELAAHRFDESLRDGETEADARAVRVVAEPLERQERALAFRDRDPAAPVDDAQIDSAVDRSRPGPAPVHPAASTPSALPTMFASARSSSTGSTSTGGRSSGTSTSMSAAEGSSAIVLPTTSSSPRREPAR